MSLREGRIVELAGAILDGTSVDWASEASRADLTERELLDQLKMVAVVADVHRRLPPVSVSTQIEGSRDASALGEQWGPLRVFEPIGRGAFGDVYRAWDTRLDREVALKLLAASAAGGDSRASSIIGEGRLMARVRHPNVVTIYGAERIDGRVGLWMELVKGRTLQQMIVEGRSFTPAEVVTIGIELGQAVEAVHAAGLLHRDIKPHNVMVEDGGRVVLMDFGTGREADDGSTAGLAGTPLYLSPELLTGSAPSVPSDIYSVGVLLYHLLAGSHPVPAKSLEELRAAHRTRQRSDLRRIRPDVPSRLARIIDRALDPRPENRYPSAGSLVEALIRQRDSRRLMPLAYGLGAAAALVLLVWVTSLSSLLFDAERNRGLTTDSVAPAAPMPRSIAVLPFKSVDAGGADEALRLGMTEAVIAQLSRISTLRVEPPARVRAHGVAGQTPLEAGRALGVDAVVQGYVQQTGTGVQVRLQLLRTADGARLSGGDRNESYPNVLEAQRRLVQSVAEALGLTPAERARVDTQDTTSPEAFRHYLFGRYHMEARSLERMLLAQREFREALAIDPRYARAHAGLSLALTHSAWLGQRGIDVMGPAKDAAMKALALDDSVALAHTALAYVLEGFEYDHVRSQAEHIRAVALDDQDLWVVRAYASFLMRRSAFDEALEVIGRALELDPASPLSNRHHAMILYAARRYDACIAVSRKTLPLDPSDSSLSSTWLGRCLEQAGKEREAVDAYEKGRAARGNSALAERLTRLYRTRGLKAYWRERMRQADGDVNVAAALVRLGELDESVRRIVRLHEMRDPQLGFLNMPEWDPLRSDSRFQAIRLHTGMSDEIDAQLAAARAAARAAAK